MFKNRGKFSFLFSSLTCAYLIINMIKLLLCILLLYYDIFCAAELVVIQQLLWFDLMCCYRIARINFELILTSKQIESDFNCFFRCLKYAKNYYVYEINCVNFFLIILIMLRIIFTVFHPFFFAITYNIRDDQSERFQIVCEIPT